jgi:hypothetical protein
MKYVETTTIVRTDSKGRLIRRRVTTCVEETCVGFKERTDSRFLSKDEYQTRKSHDRACRSSMGRIYDAYCDCRLSDDWN